MWRVPGKTTATKITLYSKFKSKLNILFEKYFLIDEFIRTFLKNVPTPSNIAEFHLIRDAISFLVITYRGVNLPIKVRYRKKLRDPIYLLFLALSLILSRALASALVIALALALALALDLSLSRSRSRSRTRSRSRSR